MNNLQALESGRYYHIYNRANGSENLFREAANYRHFLHLYDKYTSPIAHTLAWVLMHSMPGPTIFICWCGSRRGWFINIRRMILKHLLLQTLTESATGGMPSGLRT